MTVTLNCFLPLESISLGLLVKMLASPRPEEYLVPAGLPLSPSPESEAGGGRRGCLGSDPSPGEPEWGCLLLRSLELPWFLPTLGPALRRSLGAGSCQQVDRLLCGLSWAVSVRGWQPQSRVEARPSSPGSTGPSRLEGCLHGHRVGAGHRRLGSGRQPSVFTPDLAGFPRNQPGKPSLSGSPTMPLCPPRLSCGRPQTALSTQPLGLIN